MTNEQLQERDRRNNPTGNCFERSFDLVVHDAKLEPYLRLMFGELVEVRLVHGIVYSEISGWHVHGWVEVTVPGCPDVATCIDSPDNGDSWMMMPRDYYYHAGKVKTADGEIMRYTREEAIERALETERYYFSNLPCDK